MVRVPPDRVVVSSVLSWPSPATLRVPSAVRNGLSTLSIASKVMSSARVKVLPEPNKVRLRAVAPEKLREAVPL